MSVGAAVPWGSTDPWEVAFTSGQLEAHPEKGLRLPAQRVWSWSAEEVALSHWTALPAAMTHRLRGWCGGGTVSTVGYAGTYLCSLARWSDAPPDPDWTVERRAKWAAELGAYVEHGCRELGIKPKGSPGSAARALLEQQVGETHWRSSWRRPKFEAQQLGELAIYGGRNESYWTGELEGPVIQYDRGAAYLAQLAGQLPVAGTEVWTGERIDWSRPGLVHALVSEDPATGGPVPVLPAKVRTGDGPRTVYGWGEKVGVWTTLELRAAIERGARLVRVFASYAWSGSATGPLAGLAEWLWSRRKRFKWAKRVGVALVGKLHQSRVSRRVEAIPDGADLRELLARWSPGTVIVPRSRPDGIDLALVLQEDATHAWYAIPGVAAWVLAGARLELLRGIEENWSRLLSVATDSVTLRGHAAPRGLELGDGLGEWRKDASGNRIVLRGPLCYAIEGRGAGVKVRAAGIARTKAQAYLSGETVRWESRIRLTEKVGCGRWRTKTARAKDEDPGRRPAVFEAKVGPLRPTEAPWLEVRDAIDRESGERALRTYLAGRHTDRIE